MQVDFPHPVSPTSAVFWLALILMEIPFKT